MLIWPQARPSGKKSSKRRALVHTLAHSFILMRSFAVEQDREVKSARLCTCKKGYHRYYTLSLDAIKMLTLDYQILRLQSRSLRKAAPMQENLQSSKLSWKRSTGKRQNMLKSIRNNDV
jgi:hypothetical protein